jgi:hypothetical protein
LSLVRGQREVRIALMRDGRQPRRTVISKEGWIFRQAWFEPLEETCCGTGQNSGHLGAKSVSEDERGMPAQLRARPRRRLTASNSEWIQLIQYKTR